MNSFMKGMQCSSCEGTFLYVEAKNKSFSLKSALNCPHCNARLQNPEHLRNISLYVIMLTGFVLFMSVSIFLSYINGALTLVFMLPAAFILIRYYIKSMKLKNGYVQMVPLEE